MRTRRGRIADRINNLYWLEMEIEISMRFISTFSFFFPLVRALQIYSFRIHGSWTQQKKSIDSTMTIVWQVCDPLLNLIHNEIHLFSTFLFLFFFLFFSAFIPISFFWHWMSDFRSTHMSWWVSLFHFQFPLKLKTIFHKSLLKLKSRIKLIFRMKLMHVLKICIQLNEEVPFFFTPFQHTIDTIIGISKKKKKIT